MDLFDLISVTIIHCVLAFICLYLMYLFLVRTSARDVEGKEFLIAFAFLICTGLVHGLATKHIQNGSTSVLNFFVSVSTAIVGYVVGSVQWFLALVLWLLSSTKGVFSVALEFIWHNIVSYIASNIYLLLIMIAREFGAAATKLMLGLSFIANGCRDVVTTMMRFTWYGVVLLVSLPCRTVVRFTDSIIQWSNDGLHYAVQNKGVFLLLTFCIIIGIMKGFRNLQAELKSANGNIDELQSKLFARLIECGRTWLDWQNERDFNDELLKGHVQREEELEALEADHEFLDTAYTKKSVSLTAYKRGVNKTVQTTSAVRDDLIDAIEMAVYPYLVRDYDKQQVRGAIAYAVMPINKIVGELRDLQEMRT